MPEFKCINCGNVRQGVKGTYLSCPNCGYRMFEMPYNRRKLLTREIESFVGMLEVTRVESEDLISDASKKASGRFPGYNQILSYVTRQSRTEDSLDKLEQSMNQMRQHFTTPYSITVPVSFQTLDDKMNRYDDELLTAARMLNPEGCAALDSGQHPVPEAYLESFPDSALNSVTESEAEGSLEIFLRPIRWTKVSLRYSEIPNDSLWPLADELLNQLGQLGRKIHAFIRINNLYGGIHSFCPQIVDSQYGQEMDFKVALERAISKSEQVIAKKYVVDILEDGTKELREMLTCLWHGIELLMCAPLLTKCYEYLTPAGTLSESELIAALEDVLKQRYAGLNDALNLSAVLEEKTENELWVLYKKLPDQFGYLVSKDALASAEGSSERKLEALIGLQGIKESVRKIKAYALMNKDSPDLNIHMCFLGNPGTGKTEVARYIAGILYENGVLPTKNVVEVDRAGLVSPYYGATAEKTTQVIQRAMGGVLFIDEAYALSHSSSMDSADYGKEAIDTLVKAMEDNRGKFCVILAGYKNEMQKMIAVNPGFRSRIQFMLEFPNYSREELGRIAEQMLESRSYTIGEAAMSRILDITDIRRKESNFANAREIRNILDQVIMCQNMRCLETGGREIGLVDVNKYIADAKVHLPTTVLAGSGRVGGIR